VAVLQAKGLPVRVQEGFEGDCIDLPTPEDQFLLVRYPGGHIGIPESDDIVGDLLNGEVCGALNIWQRLTSVIGYLEASFPDGNYGVGGIDIDIDIDDLDIDLDDLDVRGEIVERDLPAPSLQTTPDAPIPTQHVVFYRPPEFSRSDSDFPIVYFLGGYGSAPEDFKPAGDLLDLLIVTRRIQNMYFAFLPGAGGRKGSFFVNHRVPEDQVPGVIGPTSGRYEDVIIQDLIPAIENQIANGRIRR
jgi:hypothetical protein